MTVFRILGRWLFGVISTLAFFGIVYGVVWYFFGVTVVTSKCENQDVISKVYINNEYRGETPLSVRLGMGNHIVKIEPPEGYRGQHLYMEFWSMGRGINFAETLTKLDYQVTLHSPASQPGNFMVMDGAGKPIGACGGVVCSIPLPGPGTYRAKLEQICWSSNGTRWCTGGDEKAMDFAVHPDQPTAEMTWN